jgi:DNA-binding transcriptional MerR regulator
MSAELLTIGRVLDELRVEFPKLTITKIRYLEDEGLIAPERSPGKYRLFSLADVERLRFILAQQENFYPLVKIREMLDDLDSGRRPKLNGARTVTVPHLDIAPDGLPTVELFKEPRSQRRLSREELLESAGIDESTLTAVEDFGLIKRRPSQTYYDGDDLQVAAAIGEFAEQGLEPRHLRHFATQADREADLIDQVLGPRVHHLDGEAATEATAAMAAMIIRLHTILVRNRLRT